MGVNILYLRPLTKEETDKIKAAKIAANKILSEQKKERLIKNRENIKLITGNPVRLKIDGHILLVNYDLLQKLMRKLKGWNVFLQVRKSVLEISYTRKKDSGVFELFELPPYHANLLADMPIVEVEG